MMEHLIYGAHGNLLFHEQIRYTGKIAKTVVAGTTDTTVALGT